MKRKSAIAIILAMCGLAACVYGNRPLPKGTDPVGTYAGRDGAAFTLLADGSARYERFPLYRCTSTRGHPTSYSGPGAWLVERDGYSDVLTLTFHLPGMRYGLGCQLWPREIRFHLDDPDSGNVETFLRQR